MHHTLDVYPIPREKDSMFINAPWLVDQTLLDYPINRKQSNQENIRFK